MGPRCPIKNANKGILYERRDMSLFKINLLKATEEYFSYEVSAENYDEALMIADDILAQPNRYNLRTEGSGGVDWQIVDVDSLDT